MVSLGSTPSSQLGCALYFRYSILSEDDLRIPSFHNFSFCSAIVKLLFSNMPDIVSTIRTDMGQCS